MKLWTRGGGAVTHLPVFDANGNVTRIECSKKLPKGELIERTTDRATCNRCEGVNHYGGRR